MCQYICKSLVQNLHLMRISKTNVIVLRIISAGGLQTIQRKGNVLRFWCVEIVRWTEICEKKKPRYRIRVYTSVLITYIVQTSRNSGFNCHEMAQGTFFLFDISEENSVRHNIILDKRRKEFQATCFGQLTGRLQGCDKKRCHIAIVVVRVSPIHSFCTV